MSATATPTFKRPGQTTETQVRMMLRPLPPAVVAALGERYHPHERLSTAYGEQLALVTSLTRKAVEQDDADRAATVKAIENGGTPPAPKAEKVREQLEREQRKLDTIRERVPASANEMLALALGSGVCADVHDASVERADELEALVLDSLRSAVDQLDASARARQEAAWVSGASGGSVVPYVDRPSVSQGRQVIVEAIRRVEHEAEQRAAYLSSSASARQSS